MKSIVPICKAKLVRNGWPLERGSIRSNSIVLNIAKFLWMIQTNDSCFATEERRLSASRFKVFVRADG
jgi:hypothetical protein